MMLGSQTRGTIPWTPREVREDDFHGIINKLPVIDRHFSVTVDALTIALSCYNEVQFPSSLCKRGAYVIFSLFSSARKRGNSLNIRRSVIRERRDTLRCAAGSFEVEGKS